MQFRTLDARKLAAGNPTRSRYVPLVQLNLIAPKIHNSLHLRRRLQLTVPLAPAVSSSSSSSVVAGPVTLLVVVKAPVSIVLDLVSRWCFCCRATIVGFRLLRRRPEGSSRLFLVVVEVVVVVVVVVVSVVLARFWLMLSSMVVLMVHQHQHRLSSRTVAAAAVVWHR